MNRLNRLGVATALAAMSAFAAAQNAGPPNPEAQARSAIETRQGLFKLIAQQNAPIAAMQRRQRDFDAALVARNAERIQVLGGMIAELYQLDTRQFKTIKTGALDGIWNSQADYKGKADALVTAAGALATAAKGGDQAATLRAAAEVGKACGSCHDNYRAKP